MARSALRLALSFLVVSACSDTPGSVEEDTDASELVVSDIDEGVSDANAEAGDSALTVPDVIGVDIEPEDVSSRGPTPDADDVEEDSSDSFDALDGASGEVDAGPPVIASCTVEMTLNQETETLLDMTYEGFKANKFGATIYGHMLKIWAGAESTGIEILIRTDEVDIPGEVVPGVAGGKAWLLMMVDNAEVYATQMASGTVTITSCPSEEGMLVSGTLSNVLVFEMGTMMPATLNGTFEVVLGEVDGEAVCSGL